MDGIEIAAATISADQSLSNGIGANVAALANNNNTRMPTREVELRSDQEVEKPHDLDWHKVTNQVNGWKENNLSVPKKHEITNDEPDIERSGVMIFRSNKPVLKVETGTSLGVLKLLYEAESKPGCQILGVRPKSTDGMPCIITLDESKLAESQYDILVSDKGNAAEKQAAVSGNSGVEKNSTTRCLECSRESWKSKKFTSTGMNTEVSVNPSDDIDMRVFSSVNGSGKPYGHISSSSPCSFTPRGGRMRSNGSRQPVCPGVIGHTTNVHNNGSASTGGGINSLGQSRVELRNGSPSNGALGPKSMLSKGESGEHPHLQNRSPSSPTDGALYGGQQFPREQSLHVDPGLFENGLHRRPSAFVDGRCRSPCPTTSPMSSRDVAMPMRPAVKEEYTSDSNPTVYVLPNDFDIESGMEPQITDYHHHRAPPMHHERAVVATPVHQNGVSECIDEPAPPAGGYDLPTQVRIGDMSPARDGKLTRSSPARSNSASPASMMEELGSPASQDNGPTPKLLCKICHKVFPTKSMLYKHLRGHSSDEKPYKCQECGQGFTLSSNLRQHRIIHRGYKPFQCEFCGKKFMRSNVYKQHRRIHTGEEMHKCSLCPSEFLQKYALMKHMKKQHDIDCGENI